MADNKTTPDMIGEFFREAAVLVLVFVPLEAFFGGGLTFDTVGLTLLIAVILLAVGIRIEVTRE